MNVLAAIPAQQDAQRLLALIYMETGREGQARQMLAGAYSMAPKDAAVLHEIGYGLLRCGEARFALKALDRARALDPTRADIWYHVGACLLQLDEVEEGACALRRALEINPSHVNALLTLATSSIALGDPEEVDRLLTRIEVLRPGLPESLILKTQICSQSEAPTLYERVCANIEHSKRISAINPDLFTAAALLLRLCGRPDEARQSIGSRNRLGSVLDYAAFECQVNTLLNLDGTSFDSGDSDGVRSHNLIFIIGPPGSGTNLLRLALLAHASFVPNAPDGSIAQTCSEASRYTATVQEYPQSLCLLNEDARRYLAQRYLAAQKLSMSEDHLRLAESPKDGLMHLGLVASLFPQAKVVMMSRNLEECARSIEFLGGDHPYGHFGSPDQIKSYLALSETLADHWKHRLKISFLDVTFEDFVSNVAGTVDRISRFAGCEPAELSQKRMRARIPTRPGGLWHMGLPSQNGSTAWSPL